MHRGSLVYPGGGVQGGSAEPAYKKTKLAHLRVKVPGGVRISHDMSLSVHACTARV